MKGLGETFQLGAVCFASMGNRVGKTQTLGTVAYTHTHTLTNVNVQRGKKMKLCLRDLQKCIKPAVLAMCFGKTPDRRN